MAKNDYVFDKEEQRRLAHESFDVPDPLTDVAARAVASAMHHELGEWQDPPTSMFKEVFYSAAALCRKCGNVLLVSKNGVEFGKFQGLVPAKPCIVSDSLDDLVAAKIISSVASGSCDEGRED